MNKRTALSWKREWHHEKRMQAKRRQNAEELELFLMNEQKNRPFLQKRIAPRKKDASQTTTKCRRA